jgi:6-phosphofructokinase 2
VIKKGQIQILLISLGALGALMVTKEDVLRIVPPQVSAKSAVGAGDSMVAGFVLSLSKGNNLKDALQLAVACGTAATMTPGSELCRLNDVKNLLSIIKQKQSS